MRFVLALIVLLAAAPAHAEFVMCVGPQGYSPAPGGVLPPHPRVLLYLDRALSRPTKFIATIDGKPVAVKRKDLDAMPFQLAVLEIQSERTGKLEVKYEGGLPATWTIKPIKMPSEVSGAAVSAHAPARPTDRSEPFDGFAIRLPADTPALYGRVRMRRDAEAVWLEIETPAYTPEGESRPLLRVGQFECAANANLQMFDRGFDLEVTVTLADGTTRTVTGLAPHLTRLPEPLPPQPRPKNARP